MGNQSVHSIPCVPALGPCNVTRDVGCPPMWQGRLTCTSPTQGSRLYNSEVSAHAVRDLKTTRVVLGLLRVIRATTLICCSTGCTCIPTEAENWRTGGPERRRQSGADTNDRERQRNSTLKPDLQQRHQECTKRSPAIGAVRVPRSGGGAGTPGACRTRTEVRAALASTGTAA